MRRAREIVASMAPMHSDTASMVAALAPADPLTKAERANPAELDPARRDAFLYLSGLLTAPKAGE